MFLVAFYLISAFCVVEYIILLLAARAPLWNIACELIMVHQSQCHRCMVISKCALKGLARFHVLEQSSLNISVHTELYGRYEFTSMILRSVCSTTAGAHTRGCQDRIYMNKTKYIPTALRKNGICETTLSCENYSHCRPSRVRNVSVRSKSILLRGCMHEVVCVNAITKCATMYNVFL